MIVATKKGVGFWVSRIIIAILLIATFYPFVQLLNMSLNSNLKIKLDFLGFPDPVKWDNSASAWEFVVSHIFNSLFVCAVSLVLILFMVSLTGYAFGRLNFKGKNTLFALLLAVLMIPYTLLIVPNYRIIAGMGFLNTCLLYTSENASGTQSDS